MELPRGIYDQLLDSELLEKITELEEDGKVAQIRPLEKEFLPDYLTRSLKEHILLRLKGIKDEQDLYKVANKVLRVLLTDIGQDVNSTDSVPELLPDARGHALSAVVGRADIDIKPVKPEIPLAESSLFTGDNGAPQLGKELELECESADRIDFLVSFIRNSGLNLIYPALQRFTKRGGKLRIITTTYMGASEATAIEKLRKLPNTQIKISYDTKASRLHAKAYFIHRDSGPSSAYIGSANLSRPAMTEGLEWTTKIAKLELPNLFRRCEVTFGNYWESSKFVDYQEGDFGTLTKAVKKETVQATGVTNLTLFELTPRDYQEAVLNNLKHAREVRGQYRNLVVAATGTGKTLMAAFDYKQQCHVGRPRPKLLFLVHRKEILDQALRSFREVLSDGNFGELLVGGNEPSNFDYLFSSVASFNSRKLHERFDLDHWEMVILDEAHHAEASSYRLIVECLKPRVLLGLTATPERGDGVNVIKDFDYPLAAEIRLPEALDQKLLCPFHYYAVSDNVDFSEISWKRGKYDASTLDNVLTGNGARVRLIINKVIEYLPSPTIQGEFDRDYVIGLGFCISKRHAEYMAKSFREAGIPAQHLDSDTSNEERTAYRSQLANGEINFLFVVDLFNEGVDLPSINTILFLRPTESHVIYLQQFGRGLRLTANDDKHLTVLDFIGASRKEFRFDLRFTALLPGKRNDLKKEIEHGFPHLPSGCYINFEKLAKERIIKNISYTYRNIDHRIREAFSQWQGNTAPSFNEFIISSEENPITLLTKRTWSEWKALAGFNVEPECDRLAVERHAQARLSLANTPIYLEFMRKVLTASNITGLLEHPYAQSFYQLIWNKRSDHYGFTSLRDAFEAIRANRRACSDYLEIIEYAESLADAMPPPELPFSCPLELYGRYTRQEIFAVFGKASHEQPSSNREGVMHLNALNASLHLVTFKKTEKWSESTRYADYPITPTRFHWETQVATTRQSPVGKRYLAQPKSEYVVLKFARHESATGKLISPLTYLGPANLVSAQGDNPIKTVWDLENEMPYEFYVEAKRASGVS